MIEKPLDEIKKMLSKDIPIDLIKKIPDKWEKIGDIVIIKLSKDLKKYKEVVSQSYAKVLDCKTVLNDIGGITGEYREPNVEILWGSELTETIHKENGVRYKLDPTKVMFSSGNMDERIRMANISNKKEVVVDLFAGIGYFTLPIAVHSKPKRVFACEINPVSYDYLCKNIVLNNVVSIVEPILGDNRKTAPKNVADRVIMGYIDGTSKFLQTAFECLKNQSGIIHFHEKYPETKVPEKPLKILKKVADRFDKTSKILQYKKVKSYAPGVNHYVFDVKIGEL